VLLYVGFWLFFHILPAGDRRGGGMGLNSMVLVITLNALGALAIAIIPKRLWGFANAGLHPKTPLAFVFGAGVCAVLFAAVVNLAAGALVIGGWSGAWERLARGAPFLSLPFFIAATTAWLVQDHRWMHIGSARTRRLLDAATLASAWVAASLIARMIRAQDFEAFVASLEGARLLRMLAGGIFGALIGYAIPAAVRDDRIRLAAAGRRPAPSSTSLSPQGAQPATATAPDVGAVPQRAVA
jgi:hypothetical protein